MGVLPNDYDVIGDNLALKVLKICFKILRQ